MNVEHLPPAKQRAVRLMLAKQDPSLRWRGKLSIPQNCHPLVRRLFEIMNAERATLKEVADKVGCGYDTVSMWRYRRTPNLVTIAAAVNALGYELAIVPQRDRA